MKEQKGVQYYNANEISNLLNGELTPESIKLRFENEEFIGHLIDDEWYMEKEKVDFLVDVMINKKIDWNKIYSAAEQSVDLSDIHLAGLTLDIGGGGSGIIGRLKKEKVIAIDPNKRELEEAPEGALKIIMDARELKFLNDTFDSATSFFTLMYVPKSEYKKIFDEVYRVLKTGAHFLVWDATIPKRSDLTKEIFFLPLKVKNSIEILDAGYGVIWGKKEQNVTLFEKLSKEIGFSISESRMDNQIFYLKLRK